MTDEGMAEEWVSENGFGSDCNNINSIEANREIVNAFLAGLKAGSKLDKVWHDYDAGEDCYEDTHEGRWVKRDDIAELEKAKDVLKRLVNLSNSSRSLLGGTWHETLREAEQLLNGEVEK